VRVYAVRVTASFFPLLGAGAALGRTFSADEKRPGRNHVVIVSDTFWRGRMGADPHAVGKTLRLNGDPSVVVGVLPPGFSFDYPTLGVPEPAEIYEPFQMDDYYMLRSGEFSNVRRVRVLARHRAGNPATKTAAELDQIAKRLAHEYPAIYRGPNGQALRLSMAAQPLREAIVGNQRPLLWLLLGSVGVLLMIACANTAQLFWRSLKRGREVAIRAALGASRRSKLPP